ncbi:MAG: GNAT family N-acetyltransferase [Muribaculaceae bacterium]|nr:GNAT family N-acetyltransferase [Muribaculaceae bacterium]
MEITQYQDSDKEQVIQLILDIQNQEAGINLSLQEQPDLNDIQAYYMEKGGYFWTAHNENWEVIGTIGLMKREKGLGILKKFFVRKDYRSQKVGLQLYLSLLAFCQEHAFKALLLDTPAVATASHRFYEKNGFVRIPKDELPIPYEFPDRNSYLYIKQLADN